MRMDAAALQYLREVASRMSAGYPDDCVVHACHLAEQLLRAGQRPWIGSIRDVSIVRGDAWHQPLVPLRFSGRDQVPTWNVHYLCCLGDTAYDPLVGEPIAIDALAMLVFGRELPIREAVSAAMVRELAGASALRAYIRTLLYAPP
jgi:hypothetical protein